MGIGKWYVDGALVEEVKIPHLPMRKRKEMKIPYFYFEIDFKWWKEKPSFDNFGDGDYFLVLPFIAIEVIIQEPNKKWLYPELTKYVPQDEANKKYSPWGFVRFSFLNFRIEMSMELEQ